MTAQFEDKTFGPFELLADRDATTIGKDSASTAQSVETQTTPKVVKEDESQSLERMEVGVQADLRLTVEFVENPDWAAVARFLHGVEPMITKVLQQNLKSKAFHKYYANRTDNEDISVTCTHSLKDGSMDEDTLALCLDWNASGTTVAAGYGSTTHDDWCTHKGFVCTWNIERRTINFSKADIILDLESCVTALRFNPRQPALLATGCYAGAITVYNLAAGEGDLIVASNDAGSGGHTDSVTCLQWVRRGGSDLSLMSSGVDGRILVWKLPTRGAELEMTHAFLINIGSLPRALRGKVSTLERETGISSFAVSSKEPDLFVVGGETGALLHCSFNSRDTVGNIADVPLYNPVVLPIRPHQGNVYVVSESQHHRNLFLTASSDGSVRLYNVMKMDPLVTCQIGQLGGAFMYSASWSPTRPLVFAAGNSRGEIGVFDLTVNETAALAVANVSGSNKTPVPVLSVLFNPYRPSVLATSDGDGVVKVWRLGDRFVVAPAVDESLRLHQLLNSTVTDD